MRLRLNVHLRINSHAHSFRLGTLQPGDRIRFELPTFWFVARKRPRINRSQESSAAPMLLRIREVQTA